MTDPTDPTRAALVEALHELDHGPDGGDLEMNDCEHSRALLEAWHLLAGHSDDEMSPVMGTTAFRDPFRSEHSDD